MCYRCPLKLLSLPPSLQCKAFLKRFDANHWFQTCLVGWCEDTVENNRALSHPTKTFSLWILFFCMWLLCSDRKWLCLNCCHRVVKVQLCEIPHSISSKISLNLIKVANHSFWLPEEKGSITCFLVFLSFCFLIILKRKHYFNRQIICKW